MQASGSVIHDVADARAITSHGVCARMEEGNVTNNFRKRFPDTKGG